MGIAFLISGVGECWSACGLINTFGLLRCIAFGLFLVFVNSRRCKLLTEKTASSIIVVTPEPLIET